MASFRVRAHIRLPVSCTIIQVIYFFLCCFYITGHARHVFFRHYFLIETSIFSLLCVCLYVRLVVCSNAQTIWTRFTKCVSANVGSGCNVCVLALHLLRHQLITQSPAGLILRLTCRSMLRVNESS